MTQKFGRNFRLTIDTSDGGAPVVVTMPTTIEFYVERDTLASLNQGSVQIYNLSSLTRKRIFQDRFNLNPNEINGVAQGPRKIVLEIGYSTLYKVFEGQIFSASSVRAGNNIITRIEARSGTYDIVAAQINETYQSGQTLASLFKYLIGQFPNITLGQVGGWTQVLSRPVALCGTVWNEIKKYSGNRAYIDNGNVNVLQDNEVLNLQALVVDQSTGILETPQRFEGRLVVQTLLEPSVTLNQLVNLSSSVETAFNSQYKTSDSQYAVKGIRHEGIISGAVGGEARTTISLLQGSAFYKYTQVPAS